MLRDRHQAVRSLPYTDDQLFLKFSSFPVLEMTSNYQETPWQRATSPARLHQVNLNLVAAALSIRHLVHWTEVSL
jgi:hypothetical protein